MATKGSGIDLLKDGSVVSDYTSLDYESVFEDLKTFAQTRFSDRWTNFNDSEMAVIFLSIQSYLFDLLTFQFNAQIGETNPLTAQIRQNFIDAARALDFRLKSAVGSSVDITITSDPAELPYQISASLFKAGTSGGIVFMPSADTLITTTPQVVPFIEGDLQLEESLGASDGRALQDFDLNEAPLIDGTLIVYVDGEVWTEKTTRADAQSTDKVYFTSTDENDLTTVRFGDNINGIIPALGAEIRATYRTGGGLASSNAGAETITQVVTPVPGVTAVTNLTPATGGRPRQTLEEGKSALPASISTNRRAITAEDYAGILFTSDPALTTPSGVAKASAVPTIGKAINLYVAPAGGGAPSTTLKSSVSAYMGLVKEVGRTVNIKDPIYIPLQLEIDAYIESNFQKSSVISDLRAQLVTEGSDDTIQFGIFDFDNMGFGSRDDTGEPQITITRLQEIFASFRDKGLQKAVIRKLTATPILREPTLRINGGNGVLDYVTVSLPPDEGRTPRREYRILFSGPTSYKVYQRIVGYSTFVTDDRLVDDRLEIEELGYPGGNLPSGTTQINPNRYQDVTLSVDSVNSAGSTVITSSTSSMYGVSATGDEYYIEFFDGSGTLGAPYTSDVALLGNVSFQISAGTTAFSSGDEVFFDVFDYRDDVLLRQEEFPIFTRNTDNVATELVINPRSSL